MSSETKFGPGMDPEMARVKFGRCEVVEPAVKVEPATRTMLHELVRVSAAVEELEKRVAGLMETVERFREQVKTQVGIPID